MKIRVRLAFLYTALTVATLVVSVSILYYAAGKSREKEFYTLLHKEAVTKANLFLDAKVENKTLQDIYRNNRKILDEVEVAIYDTSFTLLYHDAVDLDFVKEDRSLFEKIRTQKEVRFYQEHWQVIGMVYLYDQKEYVITAAAYDQYGYTKLHSMLLTSVLVVVGAVFFIYALGYFFSKKAFAPVVGMTLEVQKISAHNLHDRLEVTAPTDELSGLAQTFNKMLDRLEASFEAQKNFVSNTAHEIRTPLSALVAELEWLHEKERSVEAYRKSVEAALEDTKRIIGLSDSMLDLARASYDISSVVYKPVRIDEVLIEARQKVLRSVPDACIVLQIDEAIEHDIQLSVMGDEYLLMVAFANILDNACKYSADRRCVVHVSSVGEKVTIHFSDKGIGIAEEEISKIFQPFYRGHNRSFSKGHGIGLTLAMKIISIHEGTLHLKSTEGVGASVVVCFEQV
jgi:two-component system sensor histidine kinase ArlS